ncbi:uncharacterized protein, partial [Fopius arisanus]|uniref:Uncharacterized protein n=1 Tax=Fopius arisanus TaxID=64838 RepID=A0A9R1SVJ2_9HYME
VPSKGSYSKSRWNNDLHRPKSSDKYYDCLQCNEYCHHETPGNDSVAHPRVILKNCINDRHRDSSGDKSPINFQQKARRRSSLARPVRVYDSASVQSVKLADYPIKAFENLTNSRVLNEIGETAYYNGGLPFDDNSDSDNGWPIRVRLEEMLELTSTRRKNINFMKSRKRKKVTLTKRQTYFKDTDKLLKVFSVNHVDQQYRYNVKRCSIM